MENATMLYKYPGPHELHGDFFDHVVVDASDIESKLEDGWFLTTPEAKRAAQSDESIQQGQVDVGKKLDPIKLGRKK